jgi:hypothetical protein
VETKAGRKDAARARLQAIESEAKGKGLGLVARKAAMGATR